MAISLLAIARIFTVECGYERARECTRGCATVGGCVRARERRREPRSPLGHRPGRGEAHSPQGGRFPSGPRTIRRFQSPVNTPTRSTTLLLAPLMRTLMLRNSSGISAPAILDTTRKQFSPGRPPVNWMVGRAESFGDPDEQAHPVVNRIHPSWRSRAWHNAQSGDGDVQLSYFRLQQAEPDCSRKLQTGDVGIDRGSCRCCRCISSASVSSIRPRWT